MHDLRSAMGRVVMALWTDTSVAMLCWLMGLTLAVLGLWMKV